MSTHAVAGKQWTEEELSTLTVEHGFRLRGLEATRLDTFIDAAFAFVLTILVISFDDIPSDYQEMLTAVKRIPGFAASFAVLMMFWLQHRTWSRRYGMENPRTIFFSLTLIFVMLVYVYPLRMIFEGLFDSISGGFLSTSYQINTYSEIRLIFVSYSVGFLALSLLISQLLRETLRNAGKLALNQFELRKTRAGMQVWTIAAGFACFSILIALVFPDPLVVLAGHMYFLLIPAMFLPGYLDKRRHAASG